LEPRTKYSKKSFVEIHDGNAWHGSNMRKSGPGVIYKQVAGLTNLFARCVDRKRPNCKFGFGVT
jgi:hypothetical protein